MNGGLCLYTCSLRKLDPKWRVETQKIAGEGNRKLKGDTTFPQF